MYVYMHKLDYNMCISLSLYIYIYTHIYTYTYTHAYMTIRLSSISCPAGAMDRRALRKDRATPGFSEGGMINMSHLFLSLSLYIYIYTYMYTSLWIYIYIYMYRERDVYLSLSLSLYIYIYREREREIQIHIYNITRAARAYGSANMASANVVSVLPKPLEGMLRPFSPFSVAVTITVAITVTITGK